MKRTLILVLLASLLTSIAQAQDDRPFRFGLHISPLIGWMKPDAQNYVADGGILNLNYGFSTEFMLAQNYTFATGIDFITMGGWLEYPDALIINEGDPVAVEGTMFRKYKTQYLQLPLTIRMRTNEMGYLTFYGQFGFTADFLLKAKADDEFDFQGSAQADKVIRDDVDIQDEISFFRAGMLIGLGAEYSLGGSTVLTAGINFNNGFTDVLRGSNALNTKIEENAISNAIELSLGVIF
ncbi:MAG: PorT family protein [Bacteroidales bacterium]|nr:PorT family protein [Bacteroidales bacterium]